MKRATHFTFSPTWKVLLNDMGIDPVDALVAAGLPADLFHQPHIQLSAAEYFRFWYGLEQVTTANHLPLLLAENLSIESFDPALFASICSQNLNQAIVRISKYKPLIGPMILDTKITKTKSKLSISCYGFEDPLPKSFGLAELAFFNQLARLTTRSEITPLKVTLPEMPDDPTPYEAFFGCELTLKNSISITFSAADANKPFLTSNAAMWTFFKTGLNQRLKDLDQGSNIKDRVRSVLIEALPSGESSIELIAKRLAMSKRTLQRKLNEAAETYQSVLRQVRSELADHYLRHSELPMGEISFLLGFQETNSFFRAYNNWKGITPSQYREAH